MSRSYWPRYFAVDDSGWTASSKHVGPVTKSAADARRFGANVIIIQANSREDAEAKSRKHWDYCRELNKAKS